MFIFPSTYIASNLCIKPPITSPKAMELRNKQQLATASIQHRHLIIYVNIHAAVCKIYRAGNRLRSKLYEFQEFFSVPPPLLSSVPNTHLGYTSFDDDASPHPPPPPFELSPLHRRYVTQRPFEHLLFRRYPSDL
jgi:hypothetical protein